MIIRRIWWLKHCQRLKITYPIMKTIAQSLADFIDMVEEDLYGEQPDEPNEELIKKSVEKTMSMVQKIDSLKKKLEGSALDVGDELKELTEWADSVKKSQEIYTSDSGKTVELVDEDPKDNSDG
jgi:hypothetical protein